jgi:hypothetical protein
VDAGRGQRRRGGDPRERRARGGPRDSLVCA